MTEVQARWANVTIFVLMLICSWWQFPHMPETIATRFDLSGNPSQYMSSNIVAWMIPAFFAILGIVVFLAVRFMPTLYSMPNSGRARELLVFSTGLLLAFIHFGLIFSPGDPQGFTIYFGIGVALFMIVGGNFLGKVERNFVLGIRLPWTIASEPNWRMTHRFAGKLLVSAGIALMCAVTLQVASISLIVAAIVAPMLLASAYSFIYFMRYERRA